MKCLYCGDEHPDRASFCPKTGNALSQINICRYCGASLPPNVEFCPTCGKATGNTNSHPAQHEFDRGLRQDRAPLVIIVSVILLAGIFAISSNGANILVPTKEPLSETKSQWTATTVLFLSSPSATPTRNRLPTPTITPSRTLTVTPSSGPWLACEDTYLSRLRINDKAYVSYQPPLANRVRAKPNLSGKIIGRIQPGEYLTIIKGPVCANQWVWWYVKADKDGLIGWTSEGDSEDYWLSPSP